jgi:sugar/nucleoside kinase (ribokinase family)
MTKIGKTFTIDQDIFNWLVEHAEAKGRKVSYVVNLALRKIKQESEHWKCPVCGAFNDKESKSCYVLSNGVFCEGTPPKI